MSSSHAWSTGISSDELWAGTERFFLITFFFWTTSTACVLRLFMWSCCQPVLQRKVKRLSRYHSVLWDEKQSTPDSKVTFGRGLSSVCTGLGWLPSQPCQSNLRCLVFKTVSTSRNAWVSSVYHLLGNGQSMHCSQIQSRIGSKLQPNFQQLCSFLFALVLHFFGTIFEEGKGCIFNEHFKN